MPKIEIVDPAKLKEEKYQAMLLPSYRNYLKDDFPVEDLLLFSLNDPEPVSLIAVDHFPILQDSVFQSIYTHPSHRRKGYATTLYNHVEALLRKDKTTLISLNYGEEEVDLKETDAFFTKIGYSKAKPLVTRYFVDIQEFLPPWFETTPDLPEGFEISLFSPTPEELKDLKIMIDQGTVSPEVDPLEDLPWEPVNSLVLRYNGKPVGWMVTKRLDPRSIGYTSFYIDRDLRGKGLASTLLARSIRLHQKTDIPIAIFEINNQAAPASWKKFALKRLEPFSYNKLITYRRNKILNYI